MRLLIIDGLNLVRRIYAGVPGEEGTSQHDEDVLTSSRRSLGRALDQTRPSHAVLAMDASGKTWRHKLHPAYKADRKPMPDALSSLLPRLLAAFEELGVRAVQVPGFEADDVIASIARKISHSDHGIETVVLSTDKGLLPLLAYGVQVRNHFEERDLTADYAHQRFGVSPPALPLYLALVGDRAAGIPGVKSVGAKTAATLVQACPDLDTLMEHAATRDDRIGAALRTGEADARLSLRLVNMREDVETGMRLSDFRLP